MVHPLPQAVTFLYFAVLKKQPPTNMGNSSYSIMGANMKLFNDIYCMGERNVYIMEVHV